MLACSLATSPLYPHNYSYDSAFFRFFGSEILNGKTPYKDVWDHKGPVLYFLQAVGALGGTTNKGSNLLFVLQITSILTSVFFIWKTYLEFGEKNRSFLKFFSLLVCVLSVFSLTIESGNLSEEWTLPFACGSIWMMTRYALNTTADPGHPRKYAFFHGIGLGIVFMIRINNAIPVCAGILIIGFYLILKKQWKNLFDNLVFGLLGIVCIIAPVCIWFYSRNALQEMIYAVYNFNLKYAQVRSFISYTGEPFITRYLPIAAAILIFVIFMIRKQKIELIDCITAAVLAAGTWMLTDTNMYLHYFTIFIPVFFFTSIRCADRMRLPEMLILLIVFGWFGILNIQRLPDLLNIHRQGPMFTDTERIPPEDRNAVIAVNLPPEIYLNYGLEPISRFCAYQHVHFSIAPEMKDEFLNDLYTKKPQWILAFCSGETKIPEVQDLIDEAYQYRFDQSDICYYQRK